MAQDSSSRSAASLQGRLKRDFTKTQYSRYFKDSEIWVHSTKKDYIGANSGAAAALVQHRRRGNTERNAMDRFSTENLRSEKQLALSWSRDCTVQGAQKFSQVSQLAMKSWGRSHLEMATLQLQLRVEGLNKHGYNVLGQAPSTYCRVYLAEQE